MKTMPAPALSEHLLREAARFLMYPNRAPRNLQQSRRAEDPRHLRRRLVGWRTTFAPQADNEVFEAVLM